MIPTGMPEPTTIRSSFVTRGQRLAYSEWGEGPPTVLLPGLLLPVRMQEPLARHLAGQGNRVILLDPLGHGSSARPDDMWRYSMSLFAADTVALLDHLDIARAVVGGTSLGANVTLEVASLAPERLQGMLLEMPVLDNALVAAAAAFAPLLIALTLGEPLARGLAWMTRRIPHAAVPFYVDIVLDAVRQDPRPSAALLQGLFFGRVAPHREERQTFRTPALVIGHHRDPVHLFSDSDMLAAELENGRLLEAETILEMRYSPERLWREISSFVETCWEGTSARRRPATSARRRTRAAAPRRRARA